MDNKIHRCRMTMEVEYSGYHQTMAQCSSIFHSSLKHDCENVIQEVIGGDAKNINIDSINIDLGDFHCNVFESQFRMRFIQAFREQLTDRYSEQKSIKQKEMNDTTFSDEEQVFSRYLHSGCWPYADKWQQEPASWLAQQLTVAQEKWYPFVMSACLQALPRYRLWLLFEQNHILRHYCAWPKSEANLLLYALRYFQCNPHLQASYLSEPVEKLPQFDCSRAETKQLLTPLLAVDPSMSATASSVLSLWVSELLQQKAVQKLAESDKADGSMTPPSQKKANWAAETSALKAPSLESMPICNAGLVALWPLLPDLFRRLGLWENGQFVSQMAQSQAACWLDWVVWQEDEPQPRRMAFSRWLCGLEMDGEPELHSLAPEIQKEAMNWLAMLPKQLPGWKMLREADVRQLFLQRPGSLMIQRKNRVLCVEPEPWDVMLLEWPWSFTGLMLPWLSEGLNVDWAIPQNR